MILLNEIIPLNVSEDFYSVFEVVIQLGAILAVVLLFWKQIFPFGKKNNPYPMAKSGPLSYVNTDIFVLWIKILVACIPAAIIGILFNDYFEALFYNSTCVAIALIVFGIAFIVIETVHKNMHPRVNHLKQLTMVHVILIGVFQLIAAIFPGTSRSGATIVGALLIGVSRTVAAEFTFFLAIPVMFGASLLKLVQFGFSFSSMEERIILLTGMAVAFLYPLLVIKFLMGYIKKHDFKIFGWYRTSYLVSLYFWLFSFSFKAYPFTAKMDFPPDTKGGKSILEVFMERILNYQVSSDDLSDHNTSCTVQSLLQHRLHLTKKEISRAKFLKNGILADNLPVYINTHLQKGQLLSVCIERTQMEDCTLIPYAYPLTVLYEDEDMICIDKPPGMAVHPSHGHYSDTIVNALAAYFYQQNKWIIPRIIGRLDKDTSGLLVFAKNQPAAARLTAQHKDGRFLRTYLALVEGIPKKASGISRRPHRSRFFFPYETGSPTGWCLRQNVLYSCPYLFF